MLEQKQYAPYWGIEMLESEEDDRQKALLEFLAELVQR
ncbi:hypothetical protein ACVWYU_003284 [Pseudomonas sp. TE12234]|jgi:hypothetical protein